jgi:periplasmic copper chaperone A
MVVPRFLAAAALTVAATAAQAAPQVTAAWSRPAAQGTTGVGFMVLTNPDPRGDALVSVETPLAGQVQIHQSSMTGGVAAMRKLDRVALPVGGRVTFAPGGYHLMFMGLKRPLKAGDSLPAILVFSSGAKVKVSFVVGLAPPADAHAHH